MSCLESTVKKLSTELGVEMLSHIVNDLCKKVEELQNRLCAIEERKNNNIKEK